MLQLLDRELMVLLLNLLLALFHMPMALPQSACDMSNVCPTGNVFPGTIPNLSTRWEADCITFVSSVCGTPSDGTAITSWADESGNADTLTESSGTSTYHTNKTPSGEPSVTLSSARWAAGSQFGLNGSTGGTAFVVVNVTSGGYILSGNAGGSHPDYYINTNAGSGPTPCNAGTWTQGQFGNNCGTSSGITSTWFQGSSELPGTISGSWGYRLNQATDVCQSSGCSGSPTWGSEYLQMGYYSPAGCCNLGGQVSAIITYTRNLSLSEIQQVETYLHNKYGV